MQPLRYSVHVTLDHCLGVSLPQIVRVAEPGTARNVANNIAPWPSN